MNAATLPRRTACLKASATNSSTSATHSTSAFSDSRYGSERWYEPTTGRWLSNDPIGTSGGLNQYVFCGDNPVNGRDLFGFCKSGEQFIDFYVDRMTTSGPGDRWPAWGGWNPLHVIGDVLSDPDIDIGQTGGGSYTWRGGTYTASQMGNIAAGYVTTGLWTPIVAGPALIIAEFATNDGDSLGEYVGDLAGSFWSNLQGTGAMLHDFAGDIFRLMTFH